MGARGPIYLDYNSTTPLDDAVLQAMLPWLRGSFGNTASQHLFGQDAARAVERSRQQVATFLGCSGGEVVFTSGATEANNLALKGALEHAVVGRRRLLVSATEHKSVLDTATWLRSQGAAVNAIPVRRDGTVDLAALKELLAPDVALVSVMVANNETGVLNPIEEVSALARSVGALTHTDATQALGKVPVDVRAMGVDMASVSSHKVYGPQGVGALYVRRRTPLAPVMHGGGHERGFRSGTHNVAGIVGFGAAAAVATGCLDSEADRMRGLLATLRSHLAESFPDVQPVATDPRTGSEPAILPNTLNFRFPGVDAEAIMAGAPGVAVSAGSACTSLVPQPSHVLLAMLEDSEIASQCLRFSLGRFTTESDVVDGAKQIGAAATRLLRLTPPRTAWC